jgi:hypothetical protein
MPILPRPGSATCLDDAEPSRNDGQRGDDLSRAVGQQHAVPLDRGVNGAEAAGQAL